MKKMKLVLMLLTTLGLFIACSGYGEKVVFDGTEVYYKAPVTQEMANRVGEFLVNSEFTDGTTKSIQLTKEDTYNFRMVTQEQYFEDTSMDISFKALSFLLSKEVFDGAPVTFQVCDELFNTKRTIAAEAFEEVE